MADVYKQSFKQNYTNNIELSIFNCGIERCAPSKTWGPGIRDHYLIHLVLSGKGEFEVGGRTWQVSIHTRSSRLCLLPPVLSQRYITPRSNTIPRSIGPVHTTPAYP